MNSLTDFTTALAANNPSAKACDVYWDASLNDCFRETKWTFCTVQTALTDLDITVLGWDYIYTLPASSAIVWNVYNEENYLQKHEQEFEELYVPTLNCTAICADLDDAYCDYSYVVTDVTKWDYKFIEAFSYKLAGKMAHLLVGDPNIGLKMGELYSMISSEAKRINAYQQKKKPNQESGYVDSRM
jgi:hypothetical protein